VPPSDHPSGEAIKQELDGVPTEISASQLRGAVSSLAAANLIVKHYPSKGSRHEMANALAGWLIRGGWSTDKVTRFLGLIADAADDEELKGRLRNIGATQSKLDAGKPATGAPTLAGILGEQITRTVEKWLGLNSVNCVNSVQGWKPLIEFTSGALSGPEFPIDCLSDDLGAYVKHVAETVQVPVDMPAMLALGVLAAASAGRAEVAIGQTHTEPLNIYFALVAGSGERKDPAVRAMRFPLEEADRALQKEWRIQYASAAQERKLAESHLRQLEKNAASEEDASGKKKILGEAASISAAMPELPPRPQVLVTDSTPEALARTLGEQGGRIAWIDEEAGTLVEIILGRYSKNGPDLDVFLKAYDGGAIRANRITRESVHVDRPALTIAVTPQPVLLERIAAERELRGRGLLARFAFVIVPSLVGTRMYQDKPIPSEAREAYANRIAGVLSLPLRPQDQEIPVLRIQGPALGYWTAEANAIERAQAEGGRLASVRDWASKHAGRVARIAGLLHLAEHAQDTDPFAIPISVATVEKAWRIGHYLTEHALVAFSIMAVDPDVRLAIKVRDWIRRCRINEFSIRDCHQQIRFAEPRELLRACEVLQGRNHIRSAEMPPRDGPGRKPSPRFVVNPRTHAHNSQNSQKGGGKKDAWTD
jgi:hypothetical protein